MSHNDITGDKIVSKTSGQGKFAAGWDLIFAKARTDAIFGKNQQALLGEAVEKPCGCKYTCEATREKWDEDCFGYNSCAYCDNGYFPCNQYCIVMS